MKALVLSEKGSIDNNHVQDVPLPVPNDDQVLIKVVATAINPVDWKMALYGVFIPHYPIVLGCDVAGEVVRVGANVTNVQVGDRIYSYKSLGAGGTFSEYSIIEGFAAIKIPQSLTYEQASSLPVSVYTTYLSLFSAEHLNLSTSSGQGKTVLVWGAASSVGISAVQVLAHLGYNVIATASPQHHDYVRELGASQVFNYRDENVVNQIREATGGNLKYVFDTVGDAKSLDTGSHDGVRATSIAIFQRPEGLPEYVHFTAANVGITYSKPQEVRWLFSDGATFVNNLIDQGKLKPPALEIFNGIGGIVSALKRQQEGVSATKVVVKL